MSAIPCLMLLFSAAMKFAGGPEVEQGFTHLGWPMSLAAPLGILEITCTVIYLVPRTAVLGAILLSGYLGGAIATHARIQEAWFMPALLLLLLWGGLYLREPRMHALLPLRKTGAE